MPVLLYFLRVLLQYLVKSSFPLSDKNQETSVSRSSGSKDSSFNTRFITSFGAICGLFYYLYEQLHKHNVAYGEKIINLKEK